MTVLALSPLTALERCTTWDSENSASPHPFSTPRPLHLNPPKGCWGASAKCVLTQAVPHSSCAATSAARSASAPRPSPFRREATAYGARSSGRGPGPDPTPSFSRKKASVWSSAARGGRPLLVDQVLGQDGVRLLRAAVRIARSGVDLDGDECVAELASQGFEALLGADTIVRETQAEQAGAGGGPFLDLGQVAVGDPDVGLELLGERERE